MRRSEVLLLAQICAAHFVSHVHLMVVPALIPLLPGAMGVGFTGIGFAIAVASVVSALVQAPLGFAVDRFGPRRLLAAGLGCGSLGFLVLALAPSYPVLIGVMVLIGLANGVYHPADYALLSRGIAPARMGRAFSIHTFAGYLGSAVTPGVMIGAALVFGIGWAFATATLIGLAALAVLLAVPSRIEPPADLAPAAPRPQGAPPPPPATARILSPAVLMLTGVFMLLSLGAGGLEKFSVAAFGALHGTPLALANTGLTALLFASAAGVLAGGWLADRTARHGRVAAGAFGAAAVLVALMALAPLPGPVLVAAMGAAGFLTGVVAPSRDMLVRAASPRGAEGRTFGIVSTGFNLGGIIGPVLFGAMLDRALPGAMFALVVVFMLLTVAAVLWQDRGPRPAPAPAAPAP